jgi:hypothetical protein
VQRTAAAPASTATALIPSTRSLPPAAPVSTAPAPLAVQRQSRTPTATTTPTPAAAPRPLPVGAVPAPAARLIDDDPVTSGPNGFAIAEQAAETSLTTAAGTLDAIDREALIDDIVERLRLQARVDRERLGYTLEDLL